MPLFAQFFIIILYGSSAPCPHRVTRLPLPPPVAIAFALTARDSADPSDAPLLRERVWLGAVAADRGAGRGRNIFCLLATLSPLSLPLPKVIIGWVTDPQLYFLLKVAFTERSAVMLTTQERFVPACWQSPPQPVKRDPLDVALRVTEVRPA